MPPDASRIDNPRSSGGRQCMLQPDVFAKSLLLCAPARWTNINLGRVP